MPTPFRCLAVFLAGALWLPSEAGVSFNPHPGYPAPNYFSGTNARAFYQAGVTYPHNHISRYELYLNDILTDSQSFTATKIGSRWVTVVDAYPSIMFDSHYYAYPLSSIVVKLKVQAKDTIGGASAWYESSYTVPNGNLAALFGINELEVPQAPNYITSGSGAITAGSALAGIGHPKTLTYEWDWTHDDLSDRMDEGANVFYYAGHSSPLAIYDGCRIGLNSGNLWVGNPIYATFADAVPGFPDFATDRLDQVGNDALPPFNASAKPALNLAVNMSCDTFYPSTGDTKFTTMLLPYYNGYGQYMENQAVVGWKVSVDVRDYQQLTGLLFEALTDGQPASQGLDTMIAEAGVTQGTYSRADACVRGDNSTRLRRAYDPTGNTTAFWRRVPMP